MLRTCGGFPVYLRTSELLEVRKFFSQGSLTLPFSLNTGQYRLELNPRLTELSIKKPASKDGVHEYVWYELLQLVQRVRNGLSNGSLGQSEQITAENELLIIEDCISGIPGSKYLSSGRNDIQYRQQMNCWRPEGRIVKSFNYVNSDSLIWSDSDPSDIDVENADPFTSFINRCLVVCKISHNFLLICSGDQGSFLKSDYIKYHNTLMI